MKKYGPGDTIDPEDWELLMDDFARVVEDGELASVPFDGHGDKVQSSPVFVDSGKDELPVEEKIN